MAKKEVTAVVYKLKDQVTHERRNGVKVKAVVVKPEYPTTKGSWIDIQPVDKKGEAVGKTITCRPSQLKLVTKK